MVSYSRSNTELSASPRAALMTAARERGARRPHQGVCVFHTEQCEHHVLHFSFLHKRAAAAAPRHSGLTNRLAGRPTRGYVKCVSRMPVESIWVDFFLVCFFSLKLGSERFRVGGRGRGGQKCATCRFSAASGNISDSAVSGWLPA